MGRPDLTRETKLSGANGDRENSVFPVQLTTSRIGNPYPVDAQSAESDDHTHTHTLRDTIRSKIQQNWKHAAQDALNWPGTVTEGGRRYMTDWWKEEEKSKTRQEKKTAK